MEIYIMSKVDMEKNESRKSFKLKIDELYGEGTFTKKQALDALLETGQPKSKWCSLHRNVLEKYCSTDEKNVYTFKDRCDNSVDKKPSKKTIKKDLEIIEKEII